MMCKTFCLLMALLLICPALAEDEVFAGILSNGSLEHLESYAFQVFDDEEDDLFFDEGPVIYDERASSMTITMGGDAVVGIREIWWQREDALPAYLAQYGMAYPFSGLQSVFADDDLTYINLECTLKDNPNGEVKNKEYRFRGLTEYTQVLTEGSVELLNIANNHYVDYRNAGCQSTRQALLDAGLPFAGYGYAYIWQYGGWRIGFAGCRETEYKLDPDIITREAKELRSMGCDVVIYACHWGREYNTQHNEDQLAMAQVAAAAGVDIVVGTHPHVVQGLADVDGTVVLWSLGNLMFGGTINMQTYDSALAQVELQFGRTGYTGCTVRYLPVLTSSAAGNNTNDYHPVLAEGEDYDRIMAKIQYDSEMSVSDPVFFPARK